MLVAHSRGALRGARADHTEAVASKKIKLQEVEVCSGEKDQAGLHGVFGVS